MHAYLLEMLECPGCHGELVWNITEQDQNRIEAAEAHCQACRAIYPVYEGIGLFLTPDLQRNDLWEQVESGLMQHLRTHPELERQLTEVPLETLALADRFFRAFVLEERGKYLEAKIAEDSANQGLYISEYKNCRDSQFDYVIERLSTTRGAIVDLASGRGYLVEALLRRLTRHIVMTDFSPRTLRADRRRLESLGLYDRVSLLAFDARRTPFRDAAVETLTTNLGLQNIEEPGLLLQELRRIVAGEFLAISHFFPEEDKANTKVIHEAGLETMLYRRTALEQYAGAGWNVEMKNTCTGEAHPTPPSELFGGVRADGLPVANTRLEWCVLLAGGDISNGKQDAA